MENECLSADGTHVRSKSFRYGQQLLRDASKAFGKDIQMTHTWKDKLIDAGFEDVTEKRFRVCAAVYLPLVFSLCSHIIHLFTGF